jgi:5-methylcytosine-specific restriction enzyme A
MPQALKHPCAGSCGALVSNGYCTKCQSAGKGKEKRPSAAKRLYGRRWRKSSKDWLANPDRALCVGYPPGFHGERSVAAQVVDHIAAHKGDWQLFWDESNWQPLCISCNSRKAATVEGGFGHGYARTDFD